jgi:hypothetical protein
VREREKEREEVGKFCCIYLFEVSLFAPKFVTDMKNESD